MKKIFIFISVFLFLTSMFSGCLEKFKIEDAGTIIFCDF
jgi:hypothetical protein